MTIETIEKAQKLISDIEYIKQLLFKLGRLKNSENVMLTTPNDSTLRYALEKDELYEIVDALKIRYGIVLEQLEKSLQEL